MRFSQTCCILLSAGLVMTQTVAGAGISFDPDDDDSVKAAAKIAAKGLVSYYHGDEPGQTPGVMPYPPYYWWIGGAMFQSLIDYWYYTGDDTYNDMVIQGMMHQVGSGDDYKPANQSTDLGNDDQAFWAMAAMSAAENKFPNPPSSDPQWLALVQAVFNEQAADWNKRKDTCNGGMMWQIFEYNNGYGYKNTISNGCFFNMGARLAAYTGNKTYADWAEKTFDWTKGVGLITDEWQFLDGAYTTSNYNCTKTNPLRWSYNAGVFLHGAANMYRYTNGSDIWKQRLTNITGGLKDVFFNEDGIMNEITCEPAKTCNNDQQTFKAHTSRWMAATIKLAPFLEDELMPLLRNSSIAAAKQCSGPDNACGLEWTKGDSYDGITGPGEQMAAMQVFMSNLISTAQEPADSATGNSTGDPSAGTSSSQSTIKPPSTITRKDEAGAVILTIVVVVLTIFGTVWVALG